MDSQELLLSSTTSSNSETSDEHNFDDEFENNNYEYGEEYRGDEEPLVEAPETDVAVDDMDSASAVLTTKDEKPSKRHILYSENR